MRPLRLPDGVVAVDRTTKDHHEKFITLHRGHANGPHLGNLRKLAEDQFTQTPWQAFGPAKATVEPNELLGSYFSKDGRSRALSALLRFHNL